MLDSDWLIVKFSKTPWLDWMISISARLNSSSILIFFHIENTWLRNSFNCFDLLLFAFKSVQLFFSKNLGHSKSPIFLSLPTEMQSLKRKARVACLEWHRKHTFFKDKNGQEFLQDALKISKFFFKNVKLVLKFSQVCKNIWAFFDKMQVFSWFFQQLFKILTVFLKWFSERRKMLVYQARWLIA